MGFSAPGAKRTPSSGTEGLPLSTRAFRPIGTSRSPPRRDEMASDSVAIPPCVGTHRASAPSRGLPVDRRWPHTRCEGRKRRCGCTGALCESEAGAYCWVGWSEHPDGRAQRRCTGADRHGETCWYANGPRARPETESGSRLRSTWDSNGWAPRRHRNRFVGRRVCLRRRARLCDRG